jgi:prepilin-type N-terminal cleavage/methylation domain-containing protein
VTGVDAPRTLLVRNVSGFTLVEVTAALAIIGILAASGSRLVSSVVRSMDAAHARTTSTLLARSKMEELLALAWRMDGFPDGTELRVSDLTSDLTRHPPGAGGPGLQPSPGGSADHTIAGYADLIDARGRVVGTDANPQFAAAFVRRWSIAPLVSGDADTLRITVVVRRVVDDVRRWPGAAPVVDEVRLVSLRTRSRSWP